MSNINVPRFDSEDEFAASQEERRRKDLNFKKWDRESNPTNPNFDINKFEKQQKQELAKKQEELRDGINAGKEFQKAEAPQIQNDQIEAMRLVAINEGDLWPPAVTMDQTKNTTIASNVGGTEVRSENLQA